MPGGRFRIREAIRHTNKGGVYRGTDVRTGSPAVIKGARPHVEADARGRDVRDRLRTEAVTPEKLKDLQRRCAAPAQPRTTASTRR